MIVAKSHDEAVKEFARFLFVGAFKDRGVVAPPLCIEDPPVASIPNEAVRIRRQTANADGVVGKVTALLLETLVQFVNSHDKAQPGDRLFIPRNTGCSVSRLHLSV